MARPTPPSGLTVNGHAESSGMATKISNGVVALSAIVHDADDGQKVRLHILYSSDQHFKSYRVRNSAYVREGTRVGVSITGLHGNTRYFVKVYAQDAKGNLSSTHNGTDFWTDRYPTAPTLVVPAENVAFPPGVPIVFDWQYVDPDGGNPTGFILQYRHAGTATQAPGPWTAHSASGTATTWTSSATGFTPGITWEWMVKQRDDKNRWGEYSLIRSFTVSSTTTPPRPLSPAGNIAVISSDPIEFTWQFRDPKVGATQGNADIRYRVAGQSDTAWIYLFGDGNTDQSFATDPDTFPPDQTYEWQVRTYRSEGADPISDWSASSFFVSLVAPGGSAIEPVPDLGAIEGGLGVGTHRVFVFDQGGTEMRGELTPITSLQWERVRDDISTATVVIDGYDQDCGDLLTMLRTWHYEIAIYRNDERVWEGPITHLTYEPGRVTIGAKDVMAYLYRRILRQGYNDSYHLVKGIQTGLKTVVIRAGLITTNALSYNDPNVLPYLTLINTGTDAKQSRIIPDYTKTVWEEIDDMASNAGLDYTVIGRRIVFWDTHVPIGTLPEMHDGDFSAPLIVSEYGMSAANYFAVTNGQGNWGAAYPIGVDQIEWSSDYYGPLEQLASGYGDTIGPSEATTPAAVASERALLASQAQRNINNRYPAPLVVRVPDNSTINPDANVGINQLVPGVHIPLRTEATVRKFKQMQKLDSITVTETGDDGERVTLVMAPAPLGTADDPDAGTQDPGDDA